MKMISDVIMFHLDTALAWSRATAIAAPERRIAPGIYPSLLMSGE
jgi:hypothetical protein